MFVTKFLPVDFEVILYNSEMISKISLGWFVVVGFYPVFWNIYLDHVEPVAPVELVEPLEPMEPADFVDHVWTT